MVDRRSKCRSAAGSGMSGLTTRDRKCHRPHGQSGLVRSVLIPVRSPRDRYRWVHRFRRRALAYRARRAQGRRTHESCVPSASSLRLDVEAVVENHLRQLGSQTRVPVATMNSEAPSALRRQIARPGIRQSRDVMWESVLVEVGTVEACSPAVFQSRRHWCRVAPAETGGHRHGASPACN